MRTITVKPIMGLPGTVPWPWIILFHKSCAEQWIEVQTPMKFKQQTFLAAIESHKPRIFQPFTKNSLQNHHSLPLQDIKQIIHSQKLF